MGQRPTCEIKPHRYATSRMISNWSNSSKVSTVRGSIRPHPALYNACSNTVLPRIWGESNRLSLALRQAASASKSRPSRISIRNERVGCIIAAPSARPAPAHTPGAHRRSIDVKTLPDKGRDIREGLICGFAACRAQFGDQRLIYQQRPELARGERLHRETDFTAR